MEGSSSVERSSRGSDGVTDVVVVDDHVTFAELLALALRGEPDLRCVGTAETVKEGLALVDRLRPDVVVMDVHLGDGDGIAATEQLVARYPGIRVVVLTAHADRSVMHRASDAGACALLPKDGALNDMLAALRTARQGGFVVHPRLLKRIVSPAAPATEYMPPLTRREQDVLQLLADGLDARAVAKRLGITLHTCRGYIKNLLLKLDAHSQLEAVAIANRSGLIRVKSRH
jgi:DNA-binding NarL/FixJ family response regulator